MRIILCSLACAVLLATTSAQAQPTRDVSAALKQVDRDLGVSAGVGTSFGELGVVEADASLLARIHWLDLGATVRTGSELIGAGFYGGTLDLGVGRRMRQFRADLIGSVGVLHYGGVGRELLSDDPGVSATLPIADARGVLSYIAFPEWRQHLTIALSLGLESDLGRVTKQVTYSDEDWLNGGSSDVTATHSVGWLRGTATLAVGWLFDLSRPQAPTLAMRTADSARFRR